MDQSEVMESPRKRSESPDDILAENEEISESHYASTPIMQNTVKCEKLTEKCRDAGKTANLHESSIFARTGPNVVNCKHCQKELRTRYIRLQTRYQLGNCTLSQSLQLHELKDMQIFRPEKFIKSANKVKKNRERLHAKELEMSRELGWR